MANHGLAWGRKFCNLECLDSGKRISLNNYVQNEAIITGFFESTNFLKIFGGKCPRLLRACGTFQNFSVLKAPYVLWKHSVKLENCAIFHFRTILCRSFTLMKRIPYLIIIFKQKSLPIFPTAQALISLWLFAFCHLQCSRAKK